MGCMQEKFFSLGVQAYALRIADGWAEGNFRGIFDPEVSSVISKLTECQ